MSKLASFISLVKPSRKIVFGQDYLDNQSARKIKLIILINEASEKSKDRITRYGMLNNIKVINIDKALLGPTYNDSRLTVFSVLDENMARKIINIMKEGATYE